MKSQLAKVFVLGSTLMLSSVAVRACDITPFIGEICLLSFNFAPKGFALAQGQLLPINQNQALFSLLGTTYGGNGQTTFALPNLSGRAIVSTGSNYTLGQTGGSDSVTLAITQIPSHSHLATTTVSQINVIPMASNESQTNIDDPEAATWSARTGTKIYSSATPNVSMASGLQLTATPTIANAGGSQPHENRMPYLALTYVIALQGIFPSRN